jgi:hypothetical protein
MAGVDEALDRCTNYFIEIIKPYESYITLYVAKPIFFEYIFHTQHYQYKSYIIAALFFEKFLRQYAAGDRGSLFYVLGFAAMYINLLTNPYMNILSYGFLFSDNEVFSMCLSATTYVISQHYSPDASIQALILYTVLNDAALYSLYKSVDASTTANQLIEHIHSHTLHKKATELYTNINTYVYLSMLWYMGQPVNMGHPE